MADNSRKLKNVQLPTQPSDGLGSGVVETDCGAGGAIGNGLVSGAAKENVERRPCDCENPIIARDVTTFADGNKTVDYRCCICGKRNLPS